MRWVLVDKRQIAVLLLENEIPVASATESLEREAASTTNSSGLTRWSRCAAALLRTYRINGAFFTG
nr:hypothetical protein [Mycobacterium angelicum]